MFVQPSSSIRDGKEGSGAGVGVGQKRPAPRSRTDPDTAKRRTTEPGVAGGSGSGAGVTPGKTLTAQEIEERRSRVEQLVALGVAVPDELRAELALVGEWETVSVEAKPPTGTVQQPDDDDGQSEEQDEEEEEDDGKPSYQSLAAILEAAKREESARGSAGGSVVPPHSRSRPVDRGDNDNDDGTDDDTDGGDEEFVHFRAKMAASTATTTTTESTAPTTAPTTTAASTASTIPTKRGGGWAGAVRRYPGTVSTAAIDDEIGALLAVGARPRLNAGVKREVDVQQVVGVGVKVDIKSEHRGDDDDGAGEAGLGCQPARHRKQAFRPVKDAAESAQEDRSREAKTEVKPEPGSDGDDAVSTTATGEPAQPQPVVFKKRARKILRI